MNKIQQQTLARKNYSAKKQKMYVLRNVANAGATDATKEYIKQHPEYAEVAIKPLNLAYIRANPGITKALQRIADKIAADKDCTRKQIDILREVQPEFPELQLHASIWQRPMSKPIFKKIESRIHGNMATQINISGCKTLSQIKKVLKANRTIAASVLEFQPKFLINKKAVVVGKMVYPVEIREAGGRKYPSIRVNVRGKRQWIRLDALVVLLADK